jgi:hypothetical protein
MARIPDAELERLKVEVSVERLIEASGQPSATKAFLSPEGKYSGCLRRRC